MGEIDHHTVRCEPEHTQGEEVADSTNISAHEVLQDIARLLIKYRDQEQVDAAAPGSESEGAASEPEPAAETEVEMDSDTIAPAPWEAYVDHDQNWKKTASIDISPVLNAKIQWVMDHVPKISQRKILMAGAEAEADRLIALYHKPN